jgi:hypothetical protein
MASQEDIFRQQVVTLLSRCNNDVPTLIKAVTRSLNECGRSDVRAEVDGTGTVVTVAQSPYHVSAHLTNFQSSLERLVMDAKKELAAIVPPITTAKVAAAAAGVSNAQAPGGAASTSDARNFIVLGSTSSATPNASASTKPANPQRTASPKGNAKGSIADGGHHRRSFVNSHNPRDNLPNSKYNGNYLLFRYGGKYPKHANYGFYRRYGFEGQGAATSEFHNLPSGQKPDQSRLYA